ncbi:acetyltransferase [Pseudomonas sp. TH21]|uniref:acetyltransferase n=1 Tax=Pseudomonas sp. TH21 TaxID=2796387 RepID=UPI0019139194|nr:acetyltransferase [Pseudomonas sp. TH21]MBK5475965.1 acetyltransferase [Pseudomonas sp. TH21]
MKRLAILGAGGHGKVVADTAESCGWQCIEFFADDWPARTLNGYWPITGDTTSLLSRVGEFDAVIVAIGNNSVRLAKVEALEAAGGQLATLVHPSAVISPRALVGAGSVVFAGVVINVDARVGRGTILNTGCSVDHDCQLGNFTHISPGARLAGGVQVGDLSWVGIGASVKQSIQIGQKVIVGAGSVVVSDITDSLTVVGVPAKAL